MDNKFTLPFLKEITDSFSTEREIGAGGFGVVYRGVLRNGENIAVKKFRTDMLRLDDKQFTSEYNNLVRVQHRNIVRLVGYCYDLSSERIKLNGEYQFAARVEVKALCFEYLQGGSLFDHIFDEPCKFDWHTCYRIIKGVCEGLNYLHNEYSKDSIYHLDLKPANILLDKDMIPKIGDFGLSRLFTSEHTHVTRSSGGTIGYMPPEYIDKREITRKFDVFSLGVIIIQMMAGCEGYYRLQDRPEFIQLVHESWLKRLKATMSSHTSQEVKTCIEIAVKCVDTDREKRPTIAGIVHELNKIDIPKSSPEGQVLKSWNNTLDKPPGNTRLGQVQVLKSWNNTLDKPLGNTQLGQVQIIPMKNYAKIVSVDVHQAKPWIIITHFEDHFRIINYQTEEIVMPHEVEGKQHGLSFLTAKFIERKHWIVAGGCDYRIHVFRFSDDTMEKVTSFKALTEQVTSLAIHLTKPYVLSTSYDYDIGLWDWEKDWKSVQTFEEEHSGSVMQIAFNPKNTNAFGSVSEDKTVKIWGVNSHHSNVTLKGHTSNVRCLHYFTHNDKQYLITGSDDKTAKIWDLQKNECVETLEVHEGSVTTVCSHPKLPVLITGSYDGIVCFWNSNTFRLIKRIPKSDLGKVHALGCIERSRSKNGGITRTDWTVNPWS